MPILAQAVAAFQRPDIDLVALVPLLVMGALMVTALLFELKPSGAPGFDARDAGVADSTHLTSPSRPSAILLSALGLAGLIASYLLTDNGLSTSTFNAMLANDPLSRAAGVIIAGCALLAVLCGQDELARHGSRHGGEFIALILGASIGMVMMASALNTMVLFLGLELFSIALYLLCIFFPDRAASRESGMKYFLLSSAASAILLYGLALLYGATGTTWIAEMGRSPNLAHQSLAIVGSILVLCGLLFKLSVVPFHFWAPDVYEGAPTTVTAFMSVATKVAAVAALWRLFAVAEPDLHGVAILVMVSLSLASMLIGNLMALAQTSVKRMLAYSGVANAGYLLIAPIVGVGMQTPMMFFMTTYMVANMGAFLSLSVVEGIKNGEVTRADLRGLYRSHPALAAVLALSLVSLAGLPPAGGFIAKFLLFGRAIGAEQQFLPAVGIFCSILGCAYYLGTAITLFDGRRDAESGELPVEIVEAPVGTEDQVPSTTSLALGLCAAGILFLGVYPTPFLNWLASGSP